MRPELLPPPPSRSPWQLFYGAAHRLRGSWYRRHRLHLPRPVLSVGNLHWGGSGKTPLVAAVAAHLRDRGRRVAILSRGYASKERGIRLVSLGEGPLLGPRVAGDEPVLLAGDLPGVAVVVGPDRHAAGQAALYRLDPPPEIFLLDDGFSHLRLHRDLDLLAFPASDPFGGGRLAPAGRLREPLAAAARAHAALLTGELEPGDGARLAQSLRSYGFKGEGFDCPTRAGEARLLDGRRLAPGSRVLLASAIARPDRFAVTAATEGFEIAGDERFADHHDYPDATLAHLRQAFRDSGAEVVLVTSKDRVKLQGRLEAPLAELPIRAEPEAAFWTWLDRRLAEIEGKALQPGA